MWGIFLAFEKDVVFLYWSVPSVPVKNKRGKQHRHHDMARKQTGNVNPYFFRKWPKSFPRTFRKNKLFRSISQWPFPAIENKGFKPNLKLTRQNRK
jgi:hypothetical protein